MKEKKNFFKKSILILLIIIISIIGFVLINIYINNSHLKNYINNNNFSINKYNSYTLVKKDQNITTTYQLLLEKYFLTKTIVTEDNNGSVLKIGLNYNMNKTIDITLEYSGLNNNNQFGMQAQTAQFINNEFTNCKTILENNFNSKCNIMEEQAKNFSTEVNNILSEYEINLNYLKLKNMNKNNS